MSGFSSDWLQLREGADARARDPALISAWCAARRQHQPPRMVDLGCGTGANLRYLAPLLGHRQHWLLLDNDSALIDQAPSEVAAWMEAQGHGVTTSTDETRIVAPDFSATLRWRRTDLATKFDALPLGDADLVTASAFLDLVSYEWIDALAQRCRAHRCAVLFALSYDGRIAWQPTLAADTEITHLLNRHQRQDKGFGPAAGPQAATSMGDSLRGQGFLVQAARSDWRLSDNDGELQATLARGWAEAAKEIDSSRRGRIDDWLEQRLAHISRQVSHLTVGHVDLLGLPRRP